MLIDRLLASTEYARTISRAQEQADDGIRMGNHRIVRSGEIE
jgi:hypothetical protein